MGLQSKLEATWQSGEGLRQGGGWEAAAFVLGKVSVTAVVMKMVEREIPEGAAGLLLCGADSPGAAPAAPVLADVIVPEEGKLSGTVS